MIQEFDGDAIKSIFLHIKNIMDENRSLLIELDSVMGDGDLGITMMRAFTAANEELGKTNETEPGKLLAMTGIILAKAAPSTMGTLLATGFMKGGKAIQGSDKIDVTNIAKFFQVFTQGIMDRGKAKTGEKTIVDVLYPVSLVLQNAAENSISLNVALSDAYLTAQQAVGDSTKLKAQHGRAAYYQDASIGKQDAGATAGMLIIKGFAQYFQ